MTKDELIKEYTCIDSDLDLKENNLSLSDYRSLYFAIANLISCGYVYSISKNVAMWFKNKGFTVTNPNVNEGNSIAYKIEGNVNG